MSEPVLGEGPFDSGLGTTQGMWEMLSEILDESRERLPESLNEAIYALRDGAAVVVQRNPDEHLRHSQVGRKGRGERD